MGKLWAIEKLYLNEKESQARGLEVQVQVHLWLPSKLEVSKGYLRQEQERQPEMGVGKLLVHIHS